MANGNNISSLNGMRDQTGSVCGCDNDSSATEHLHPELDHCLENSSESTTTTTSTIVNFYHNRSVFITGGSGFIGKVLIEKLLRCCPGIRTIFVLIRPKWNKKPHERLQELLDSPVFDGVRSRGIEVEKKVVPVEGDVTKQHLGLSDQNLARIINEVSIIYHSAATVKFDEPLKQAININIGGVKNMIEVCRKIENLAALVHVSTAYANCEHQEIDEHAYPIGQLDPEKLIEMANLLDQDTLQELKFKLLGKKPNTYTYTKALSEWLLVENAHDLPVVICRPSIVVASLREPFCGWVDNFNGPTGVLLGTGKGLLRTMLAEKSKVADLVPVDTVINLIVTLGWFAHIYKTHKYGSYKSTQSRNRTLLGSNLPSADAESLDVVTEADSKNQQQTIANNSTWSFGGSDTDVGIVIEWLMNNCSRNNNKTIINNIHHNQSSIVAEMNDDGHKMDEPRATAMMIGDELEHIDEGYGTQSPDYRPLSSLSSASGTLNQPKSISPLPSNSVVGRGEQSTAESEQMKVTLPYDDEPDELDCSSSNNHDDHNLIESEESRSSVAHYISTGERHADIEKKLKRFRNNTQLKLASKNLPKELADIPVFHCTSGVDNPITWGQIQKLTIASVILTPSAEIQRYPNGNFTNNKLVYLFFHWTLHLIPAYIVDFIARLFGGKQSIVKIYRKFEKSADVLGFFTMREWRFNDENRMFLHNELLSDEDKRLFNCDLMTCDWKDFFSNYALGVRRHILKESDDTIEKARINMRFVYYRNSAMQIIFIAMMAYYFFALW